MKVFDEYLLLLLSSCLLQRPGGADPFAHQFQVLVPVAQETRHLAAVLSVFLFQRTQYGLFFLLQGQTHGLESLAYLLLHRLRTRLHPENRDRRETECHDIGKRVTFNRVMK